MTLSILFVCLVLLKRLVTAIDIPAFFVDAEVLKFVEARLSCMRGSAMSELALLKKESAFEYFRSHELYAHAFFVEATNNPHRVMSLAEAEFEYIPLLPLNWRADTAPVCSYKTLMQDILKIQSYLEERDRRLPAGSTIKPKFSVASTYNLRTAMGWGMPTQLRRGEAWQNVTNFCTALSVGHYERYPQCPDLLRKSWKYVVELPYVSMHTTLPSGQAANAVASADASRTYMFHFSGNFALYGCEMVCSVRNAVINVSPRPDTLIINATLADGNRGVAASLQRAVEASTFCLVTKSDSYSTSFFYHAVAAGCIPILVSDWFTLSFPWAVPYESFTLRVAEVDFLKNPNAVLDHIKATIGNNPTLLATMRQNMARVRPLLSWDPVPYQSEQYKTLLSNDLYSRVENRRPAAAAAGAGSSGGFQTTLPLELLLLELRYVQTEYKYYNGLPCYRPHMCHHDRSNGSLAKDQIFYARRGDKSGVYDHSPVSRYHGPAALPPGTKASFDKGEPTYQLVDGGMQVNYLHFPGLEDARSHLCKHNGRLIGHYKIVFFMQCVRILWPLRPGEFKPVDNAGRFVEGAKVPAAKKASEHGISEVDYAYVRSFHNLSRPYDWVLTNYPVTGDVARIVRAVV